MKFRINNCVVNDSERVPREAGVSIGWIHQRSTTVYRMDTPERCEFVHRMDIGERQEKEECQHDGYSRDAGWLLSRIILQRQEFVHRMDIPERQDCPQDEDTGEGGVSK